MNGRWSKILAGFVIGSLAMFAVALVYTAATRAREAQATYAKPVNPDLPKVADEWAVVVKSTHRPMTQVNDPGIGGVWVKPEGGKAYAAIYAQTFLNHAVIGVSSGKSGPDDYAMDFAVATQPEGTFIQFRDSKGNIRHLPVSALEKLLPPEQPTDK